MNFQQKKFYLLVFGFIILLIVVFIFLYSRQTKITAELLNNNNENNNNRNLPTMEFLTDSEKTEFNLPMDAKAQVLGRDEAGAVSVYKIIRSDADLVDMNREVEPLSPRRLQVESQKLPE